VRVKSGRIRGFRVKLQRWGHPGSLEYNIGYQRGAGTIAHGLIRENDVNPWFERWVTTRFQSDLVVDAGQLHITLRLPENSRGQYLVFGTAAEAVNRPEVQTQFRYLENWYANADRIGVFENPANVDYGVRTSHYDGGAVFDSADEPVEEIDFAFGLFDSEGAADQCEERFAFVDDITGPLYRQALRSDAVHAKSDEIEIDSGWRIQVGAGTLLETARKELQEFLSQTMGVTFRSSGRKVISASLCDAGTRTPESFRISVARDRVRICGTDERGTMRGLHYLESRMRLRHAPFLRRGEQIREPALPRRITAAPFYAKSELDAPIDPYTDGLLARIARAGFNGIWVWGDLDEVTHSEVYPELDQGVARRQSRLNDLVARAGRYGIDVYVYLANRPLRESFYEKHPDLRGSELPAYGGVNILCTSVPEVRQHLRSATRNLMESVPGLKGIALIIGGEGFMHCHTRRNTCPRCSRRPAPETVAELSRAVFEGVRSANPSAMVALWPYSATNHWSKGDMTQSALISRLPRGMTLLTEFAKEADITFGGITIPAYDYPISIVGPSVRFERQLEMARENSLGLLVKTEHAIALEHVDVPYIPVFFQWAERFRRLNAIPDAGGVIANWMHYGFMPGRAADLFYESMWKQSEPPDVVLTRIAERDFGSAAAPAVLRAWKLFSEAIREYPFSGPVAMGPIQKGPAHPLFFDASYRPVHGAGRQFRNDLNWTRPWGPELTIAQFEKVEAKWRLGVAELRELAADASPEFRDELGRELGIAQALLSAVRSTIHVGRFYMLRERLADDPEVLDEMVKLVEAELHNARETLPHVCADSRLGYANSGRNDQTGVPRAGIYSPGSILKKIAQLERLLQEEIPAYRVSQRSRNSNVSTP
jgi:hypothetical protein